MNALYPIKSWAKLQMFSLWLWLNKVVFRKSLLLSKQSVALLDAEIRWLDNSLLQIGEREDEDYVVEFVARALTDREQLEASQSAAAKMSNLAVSLREKAQANSKVKEVVGTYFLCRAYTYGQMRKAEEEQGALAVAARFIPNASALTPKSVYEKFALQSKRHKELRALLAERSAIKFQINASDVIAVLTIVPAIMFVGGLWYVTRLLAEFGLVASLYYTIGDYIASSLNQLASAAVSVAWSIFTMIVGMRHGSLRSRMLTEIRRKQDKVPLIIFLFVVAVTISVIVKALGGEFDKNSVAMLGIIMSYPLGEKFAEAFTKNVLPVQMATTALLVFATLTFTSLFAEIHDLEKGRWGERANTIIKMKADSVIDPTNLVVIAANSNYVFAVDKTTKAAQAISRDQIAAISVVAN